MRELLALRDPNGPGTLDVLRDAWANGDAVLPVDPRLPAPAVEALYAALRPTVEIAGSRRRRLAHGVPILDGDALVVATSGTTGAPKGVVLTHEAIRASASVTSAAIGAGAGDRWVACLPLAHIGGLSVVTRALCTGVPVEIHAGIDPAALRASADRGATLLSLVPAALDRIDAARWRCILLGGSALPSELPPNAVRTYGMTETGSGIVYDGRPLPGVEIRVVEGELQVRGPMLLRAYRSDQPEGRDPRTADGWYATGDAGSFSDGVVRVDGRVGDVIVTGGEKVWPEPVERVLLAVPGVVDVAIGGRPHPRWGHEVVAYVVAGCGGAPDLSVLRDAVRAVLPAYCAPRACELVAAIPRTAIGKVRRSSLPPR